MHTCSRTFPELLYREARSCKMNEEHILELFVVLFYRLLNVQP